MEILVLKPKMQNALGPKPKMTDLKKSIYFEI